MSERARVTLCTSCTGCLPGYHLPYFAAAANGIFAAHGIDLEIVTPPSTLLDSVRAVADGRFDCCLNNVHWFLQAKNHDAALKAKYVFMVVPSSHLAVFAIDGRRASHGRPIESFADLDGASFIRSPGFTYHAEYFALLDRLGLETGDVVEAPYPAATALCSGEGDVTANWVDLLPDFEAAARHHDVKLRVLPFAEAGLNVYGSGIVAGPSLVESRPQMLRRLVAAVKEALITTRQDPAAAVQAARRCSPALDLERASGGWSAIQPVIFGAGQADVSGAMNEAIWRATIAHHAAAYGTHLIEPEAAFDPRFQQVRPAERTTDGPATRAGGGSRTRRRGLAVPPAR